MASLPHGREDSQLLISSHTEETATAAHGIAASCNVLAMRLAPVPKSELTMTAKAAPDLASSTPHSRNSASAMGRSLPKPKNKVPIVKVFPGLETPPGRMSNVVPKVIAVFPIAAKPKWRKSPSCSTPSSVSDAVPSTVREAKVAADAAAAAATAAAAAAASARHAATASTAAADAAEAAAEVAKAASSVATVMSAARRRTYRR